tara:strand:- start:3991 stop:4212 length:222 start_codon:yes stop_codon:yes gene_type:complete
LHPAVTNKKRTGHLLNDSQILQLLDSFQDNRRKSDRDESRRDYASNDGEISFSLEWSSFRYLAISEKDIDLFG